jgi:hypothetical protein
MQVNVEKATSKPQDRRCRRSRRCDRCGMVRDWIQGYKLFIGRLSIFTTNEEFHDHFANYGRITDCVIMKDKATNRSRGFGYITYGKLRSGFRCRVVGWGNITRINVQLCFCTDNEKSAQEVLRDSHSFHGRTVNIEVAVRKSVGFYFVFISRISYVVSN